MTRVLTGIKPTGDLHLGNYVGAIQHILRMAEDTSQEIFFFVADYHALNTVKDAKQLRESTKRIIAAYLAFGLDPEKITIYRQSDVPEIFEITTILNAVTPKGLMNRAHAYKASVDQNAAQGKVGEEADIGVNMGLYNYPILMTADILALNAELVPVGKDQAQHLEFARDIGGRFNHAFGETFKLPQGFISEEGAVIPGLDGRKMSKSYDNTIPLFSTASELKKLVMKKIITDTAPPEAKKDPEESTIYQLYKVFAQPEQVAEMKAGFEQGGLGYGTAKKQLLEALENHLAGPREKYEALLQQPEVLDEIMRKGAEKARAVATPMLKKVRKAIGAD